jgi:hypothetical protein
MVPTVPLPPLVALTLISGLAAAIAGREDLRASPRHVALTSAGLAYASYALLVLMPVTTYFYVFHGDWFLLYLLDVSRIPSAAALLAVAAQGALGMAAFVAGALLVRAQRERWLWAGIASAGLLGVGALAPGLGRLGQVGSYSQFHRNFGLRPFDGPILAGSVAMTSVALFGLAVLILRLRQPPRT